MTRFTTALHSGAVHGARGCCRSCRTRPMTLCSRRSVAARRRTIIDIAVLNERLLGPFSLLQFFLSYFPISRNPITEGAMESAMHHCHCVLVLSWYSFVAQQAEKKNSVFRRTKRGEAQTQTNYFFFDKGLLFALKALEVRRILVGEGGVGCFSFSSVAVEPTGEWTEVGWNGPLRSPATDG